VPVKDRKIKRTLFARRVAPLSDGLHVLFASRGRFNLAKPGGAFPCFGLLSTSRETAVWGEASESPPLPRPMASISASLPRVFVGMEAGQLK
jgi:hypothetical protein